MKMRFSMVIAGVFCLLLRLSFAPRGALFAAAPEVPVKGMVTMVDLGAKNASPAK